MILMFNKLFNVNVRSCSYAMICSPGITCLTIYECNKSNGLWPEVDGIAGRLVQSSLGIRAKDMTAEVDISEVQQVHEKMISTTYHRNTYLRHVNV